MSIKKIDAGGSVKAAPKRKRRAAEGAVADKPAREAAGAAIPEGDAEQEAGRPTPASGDQNQPLGAKDSVKPAAAPAPAGSGGADGVVICNNGRQSEVLVLAGVRKTLAPREIWRVPPELMDAFLAYARTRYFQAVEAAGILTISGAVTRRMKDPDQVAVKTPRPPADIDPQVRYGDKTTTVEMKVEG